jgi:hypothetical protein
MTVRDRQDDDSFFASYLKVQHVREFSRADPAAPGAKYRPEPGILADFLN